MGSPRCGKDIGAGFMMMEVSIFRKMAAVVLMVGNVTLGLTVMLLGSAVLVLMFVGDNGRLLDIDHEAVLLVILISVVGTGLGDWY